jgi:acetate kinase
VSARGVLALNAGSSSLKLALYAEEHGSLVLRAAGEIAPLGAGARLAARTADGANRDERDAPEARDAAGAVGAAASWLGERGLAGEIGAVGHRIVHGGADFAEPVLLDAGVLARLAELVPLAPLHQPQSLAVVDAARAAFADAVHVGCFDTAFHRTMPAVARAEALPRRFAEEGVRRYGFHGLSYEHVAAELPHLDPALADARVIAAHLGSGASLCAMRGGRSVATTMGMTPLDGLVMGTRAGSVDPGALLYLVDRHGLDARALETLLYRESGLLGVSGLTSDMRRLLASDDPRSRPSTSSSTARRARSARWPPRSAESTRSSSPAGSARTPRRSARGSAAARRGSASSRPSPHARRTARAASPRPARALRPGWCRATRTA